MPVFKFVEHPENNEKPLDQKCKVKFKIVRLKIKGPMEYVPELVMLSRQHSWQFSLIIGNLQSPLSLVNHGVSWHINPVLQFDEQKDQVAVEQILRVVFLDAERPSPVSLSQASSFLPQRANFRK
jgi:hypothetical protein